MQEIVKIAFLGVAGVLLAIQFQSEKKEYGIYVGLAVGFLLFRFVIRQLEIILNQITRIQGILGTANQYLAILMRVVGITYICEFSAGICRDAGYHTVAGQIEVLGKLSVMVAGLPILFAVIEQVESFL